MVGTQVTDKRLGIIGFGRVGRVVAKRARGFDMEIHYNDVKQMPPELEEGAIYHETPEDLMPHIGSATKETRDAMGFRALDNLDAIFAGREPSDRVA